jgi:hypothetical protein
VPIAITDEQLALQASIREWAQRAGTLTLVRRRDPDRGLDGAGGTTQILLSVVAERALGLPRET